MEQASELKPSFLEQTHSNGLGTGYRYKNTKSRYTECFISICHFIINYISITVGDIKTKLFLLKINVLKFMQQKFECKN